MNCSYYKKQDEMTAYFVLSTGRCGTQWLTDTLQHWGKDFVVQHEPLHFGYRPDLNTVQNPLLANAEILEKHLAFIRQQLEGGKSYIETGFPCWRHLNWFRQQLDCPVRVIHIHRDPLDTVASLLKLNAFVPPFLPHVPIKNLYLPGPEQDLLHKYKELWPLLNPEEKNLWYWAEVQWQALNYQQQWPEQDWLSLSFGQLFSEQSKQQLAAFLGCSDSVFWPALEKMDQFGLGLIQPPANYPYLSKLEEIPVLAKQLGYPSPFASNS
jgi:hypothetical protein